MASRTRVKRTSKTRSVIAASKKQMARAITLGATVAIETMKQNVPIDEGDLESTIEKEDDKKGHAVLTAGGESKISDKVVDYAPDVEYGSVHATPNGTFSIPAQPFFRIGIDDGWQEVKRNLIIPKK